MPYREDPPELAGRRCGVHLPLLERVTIAAPCPVPWGDMVGDDRVRHCRHCDQQVFDTAAMTTAEVEALVAEALAGGRVCARLHRRPDGRLITRDCREARQRRAQAARRLVALAGVAGAGLGLVLAALPAPAPCGLPAAAVKEPMGARGAPGPEPAIETAALPPAPDPAWGHRSVVTDDRAAARQRAIEAAVTAGLIAPAQR